jgi:uncharacterized repeat protein (TIGR01451 family)
MSRRKFRTSAGAAGGLVAMVIAAGTMLSAFAQEPAPLPMGLMPSPGEEPLAPLIVPIEDPAVEPAQLVRPVPVPPSTLPSAGPLRPVADPPAPLFRIQIRVPADSPPGDDIKYLIIVSNVSQADAHRVTVRNPIAAGVDGVVKAEPMYDTKESQPTKELIWKFGTMKPGTTKRIELVLKPQREAAEIKNLAYVSFEHGEAVTTRINKPEVKIAKTAPKQTVRDEPFTVRVLVENTGRVPAKEVRVVETITQSAEVQAITTGASRTKDNANQWQWEVGTLMPGQRKIIEYRVTPRQGTDLLATTNLSADKGIQDQAEARTAVLVPGLSLKLAGPQGPISASESAQYEITVRNTGTMPSTNVRVTGTIPADSKPTRKTEGGQLYRDSIVWMVPRLEPGAAQTFRFAIRAGTSGRREVAASAADSRQQRASEKMATLFEGVASLAWETIPEPAAIAVGRNGTFTVRVKNNGGEPARNVRVEIELPPEVTLERVTPNVRPSGSKISFPAEVVPAHGEQTYTITFKGQKSGQAWFTATMHADALGEQPLTTQKAVEITGGG